MGGFLSGCLGSAAGRSCQSYPPTLPSWKNSRLLLPVRHLAPRKLFLTEEASHCLTLPLSRTVFKSTSEALLGLGPGLTSWVTELLFADFPIYNMGSQC